MSEEAPKRTSSIVLVVLVLLIFFIFAGLIITWARSSGSTTACSLDASLESLKNGQLDGSGLLQTKSRIFGGGSYGLSCPTQFRFITAQTLSEKKRSVQELAKKTDQTYLVAHASSIVAKELTDCYTKMGPRGMFDPFLKIDTEHLQTLQNTDNGLWDQIKHSIKQFTTSEPLMAPPVYCAVCSQIRFSTDAQQIFKENNNSFSSRSLISVLKETTFVSQDNRESYEVLQSIRPDWAKGDSSYQLDVTKPAAVVFFKRYDYKSTLGDFFLSRPLNGVALVLIPYHVGMTALSAGIDAITGSGDTPFNHLLRFPGVDSARDVSNIDELFAVLGGQSALSDYIYGPIEGFAVVPYTDLTQFCDYVANSYAIQ
jgi:hypothetical protein